MIRLIPGSGLVKRLYIVVGVKVTVGRVIIGRRVLDSGLLVYYHLLAATSITCGGREEVCIDN